MIWSIVTFKSNKPSVTIFRETQESCKWYSSSEEDSTQPTTGIQMYCQENSNALEYMHAVLVHTYVT